MPRRAAGTTPKAQDRTADRGPDPATDFAASIRSPRSVKREPDRSRLIDETRTEAAADEDPCKPEYETGTVCPECNGRQYRCNDGATCREGHSFGSDSGIPVPECEPESRRGSDQTAGYVAVIERAATTADDLEREVEKPTARLSPQVERIVDRILDVDFEETYRRLEMDLTLGRRASQADRATVADALDRAQDNARDAHRLYAAARVDLEGFELDARAILADMRSQATVALEDEQTQRKKAKEGAKRITEADVEDWCAANFRDEWRDLQIRRKRAEKAIDNLERLAELWKTRPKTLEALLASARV